jgi:RHS repeat-associated protein
VRHVLTDNLGSADVVVDERGDTLDRLCFDAFGGPRAPPWSGEPRTVGPWSFGFAGHEHDEEFGLINMGGREYDPELGRFLTPDPIIQFPSFGQSFNGYSYALNSPLTFTDSSGYFVDALVSAVISFASGLLSRWSGGDTQGDPNWDGPTYGGGCANCQGGSGGVGPTFDRRPRGNLNPRIQWLPIRWRATANRLWLRRRSGSAPPRPRLVAHTAPLVRPRAHRQLGRLFLVG